jgi:cell division protein FtsI (penicillin-binding protein 3)
LSRRITVLKLGFVAFAALIIGRSVQLQLGSDQRLATLARRQFSSKLTSLPRRGLIFDRNGEGLAMSLKARSLFFRPDLARKELSRHERTRIIYNLSRILGMPVAGLSSKMSSERGFVWVKRQLSPNEEREVRDHGVLEYGDSVGLAEETKRFYPSRELAAHVIGSVNVDGQGLEGLELFYDGILNGERARVSSDKDAKGRKIFRDEKGLLAFQDGQSLVLTLDKAIQYEAEKRLKDAVEEHQARAGTVIVAETATGEILAMANYPTYNPNLARNSPADSRRNRAITDTYEPGSTFKPFLMALALEKGRTPRTKIYCEKGTFKVAGRRISEAEAREKFEWLTLSEIVKYSSNIGAAKLALDLGPGPMAELMERLGVGHRTDVDLPGEVPGSVSLRELMNPVRLANVGFGHGFTVTPLQMLSYYLMLANGGRWVQPKLVKAVLSEDPDSLEGGKIRWKLGHRFDSVNAKRMFSNEIVTQVNAMLETVTQEKGTGVSAQLEEWPVAGKTGTAQKVDSETKSYSREKHITSFAGFAPARDPKLVALVVLDDPKGRLYTAAWNAAPTFREVMRASLLREKVPPVNGGNRILSIANRASVEQMAAETLSAPKKDLAPPPASESLGVRWNDMRGMTVREALHALSGQPLDVEIIGSGRLRDQQPAANQWLQSGSKVRLVFESAE